ncbi:Pfs domain-containing protein [Cordyceps javanica]|uniref:Pfs domain-containing protein n=1 Tax=Cordyceps javanica TaxID=43265 RepID=A0A545WBA3_9HYPO|nr:Pfs domain-containing protein [Cordyceps javanica]TQW11232.1 Pfs domain protein [Cordyceps javanica]
MASTRGISPLSKATEREASAALDFDYASQGRLLDSREIRLDMCERNGSDSRTKTVFDKHNLASLRQGSKSKDAAASHILQTPNPRSHLCQTDLEHHRDRYADSGNVERQSEMRLERDRSMQNSNSILDFSGNFQGKGPFEFSRSSLHAPESSQKQVKAWLAGPFPWSCYTFSDVQKLLETVQDSFLERHDLCTESQRPEASGGEAHDSHQARRALKESGWYFQFYKGHSCVKVKIYPKKLSRFAPIHAQKYPSLTGEDLFLLYLNKKYGLVRDTMRGINFASNQMEKIKKSLRGITATEMGRASVAVGIEWPLRHFLQSQFVDSTSRKQPFRSLITLTGSLADAQALTAGEYLSQTWPSIADKILQLLPKSLEPNLSYASLRQASVGLDTDVKVWYQKDHILINGVGDRDVITQVLQAFVWISCTARAVPAVKGVWESIPIFSRVRAIKTQPGTQTFVTHFLTRPIPPTTQQGRCWQHMFQGAVLATGFPISRRPCKELGLEMPLNMMTELAGSHRVTEWDDKIFIKGYSTMLVAIKSTANIIIWHYYYARPGKRVSHMDCKQQAAKVSMARFGVRRHIVGWCSSSKYCAGSPDANYNIRGTQLPRPAAGLFLDKVSISTGSTITGGATLTPGVKELPPHLARHGTTPKLRWLSRKYVVFWDEEAKRGWLVNGTSALLHIVRASLAHYEKDDFSPSFMFDARKMNNMTHNQYRYNTAIGVLIDQGNQALAIYPDSITQRRETCTESGHTTHTQTSGYFLFGDLVQQHLCTLEQIVDFHSHLAGRDGINLRIRARKHLEGWDFADLAKDYDPMPRVATIPTLGYGWVDFVRAIGAITLFGRGFGELIQPANSSTGSMCGRWNSLPPEDYLLAADVADLTAIMEQYGDAYAVPRELARSVLWHSPADTYAACPCKRPRGKQGQTAYHVSPIQVLLPSCSRARGRVPLAGSQVELEQGGAVVFGHNAVFGYRWPEKGTDEVPAKDFLVPLRNMLPVRLFPRAQVEAGASPDSSDTDTMSRLDADEVMVSSELSSATTMEESSKATPATLAESL